MHQRRARCPWGSPPQVRGKLYYSPVSGTSRGITPAGAGKTTTPTLLFNVQWDHPRRCGENEKSALWNRPQPGSPPQVRGKRSFVTDINVSYRITPAGAGKTLWQIQTKRAIWDHPRRCGENVTIGFVFVWWGGITPAGAGKTFFWSFSRCRWRDHPRRCGENRPKSSRKVLYKGSPPQVRGKRQHPELALLFHGITPAGAGKTAAAVKKLALCQDHPRRCGENCFQGLV